MRRISIAIAIAALGITPLAAANEVYDACMNSVDPAYTGAQQEAACKCAVDAVGDNDSLAKESIMLSGMSDEQRQTANISDEINAIVAKCFPGKEQK